MASVLRQSIAGSSGNIIGNARTATPGGHGVITLSYGAAGARSVLITETCRQTAWTSSNRRLWPRAANACPRDTMVWRPRTTGGAGRGTNGEQAERASYFVVPGARSAESRADPLTRAACDYSRTRPRLTAERACRTLTLGCANAIDGDVPTVTNGRRSPSTLSAGAVGARGVDRRAVIESKSRHRRDRTQLFLRNKHLNSSNHHSMACTISVSGAMH